MKTDNLSTQTEIFKRHADNIEASLWEIKDVYDIPTEEIARVVDSKRANIKYMHKATKLAKESKK